jgi:uncharacterized membrane protein YtjA (UPF0391 family)
MGDPVRDGAEAGRWCISRFVEHWQPRRQAGVFRPHKQRRQRMLYWTLIFLVIALVAGLFGFGGIASASAGIAKVLFAIFLVLFLVSLIFGVVRGA